MIGMGIGIGLGGAVRPVTDSYWSNVVFLVSADGNDASPALADEGPIGHTITLLNDAQKDTAQKKFGTASLLLDGVDSYGRAADHASWEFGSGDFTIEAFMRLDAAANLVSGHTICSQWTSTSAQRGWRFLFINNALSFRFTTDGLAGTQVTTDRAWTPTRGQWYHVAVSRSGNSLRLFIDGVQQGATVTTSATIFNSTTFMRIGAEDAAGVLTNVFNGHLDELRITKGVGRYTANFTPPTAAFPRG